MSQCILHAKNLVKTIINDDIFEKKTFKTLWIKDNIEINNPGFYLIAGKNGCGKSTLLRALLGLITPTKGEIHWFGGEKLTPKHLGYLPEFPVIPPTAKVKNWLAWLLDMSVKDLELTDTTLQKYPTLSVKPFLNVPANRLSKGQQQRVQLWAALAQNPRGVVLDEPFSGLDPWARVELSELLVSLISEGKFVIMSSHELTKGLRSVCKETWLLENETITVHLGCILPE